MKLIDSIAELASNGGSLLVTIAAMLWAVDFYRKNFVGIKEQKTVNGNKNNGKSYLTATQITTMIKEKQDSAKENVAIHLENIHVRLEAGDKRMEKIEETVNTINTTVAVIADRMK